MRVTRLFAIVVPTALLTFLAPAPAMAYNLEGCKQNSSQVTFDYSDLSNYTTLSPNSAGRWNSAVARMRFVYTHPGGTVSAGEFNYGNTTYAGITTYSCSGGYMTTGLSATKSRLNTYFTDAYPNGERYTAMVHELGHAVGLAHNNAHGSCAAVQVMYFNLDSWVNCGIQTPQSDDIAGINYLY